MVKRIKQIKRTDNKKPNETSDTAWIFAHNLMIKEESRVHEYGVIDGRIDDKRIKDLENSVRRAVKINPNKDFIKELNKRFYEESIKDYKDTYSGKWLIFCSHEDVNDLWERIKNLTEIGLLGNESKASTLRS